MQFFIIIVPDDGQNSAGACNPACVLGQSYESDPGNKSQGLALLTIETYRDALGGILMSHI